MRELSAINARINQWSADHRGVPTIATGDCHVTSPGMLPFKGVIHTVGPVWKDGTLHEDQLLWSAHTNALRAAQDRGWLSVAFPAVSCGLFRFPVKRAAPIALWAASCFPQIDTTFVLFEDAHYEAFQAMRSALC